MKKKILAGLLITCCLFAVVGCSSGGESATPTATAKTPIQLLNESTAARFTSVWTALNAKASNTDLSALANRVGTLEGQNAPDLAAFTAKDTALEGRIAGLESLNISDTLSDILAQIECLKLQIGSPSASPTPTPTGATPTPTPTPTVYCGIHRPEAEYPDASATNIPNGTIMFEWSEQVNAVSYKFSLWTASASVISTVITDYSLNFYQCAVPLADTYYYWNIEVTDACGNVMTDSWWFKTAPAPTPTPTP